MLAGRYTNESVRERVPYSWDGVAIRYRRLPGSSHLAITMQGQFRTGELCCVPRRHEGRKSAKWPRSLFMKSRAGDTYSSARMSGRCSTSMPTRLSLRPHPGSRRVCRSGEVKGIGPHVRAWRAGRKKFWINYHPANRTVPNGCRPISPSTPTRCGILSTTSSQQKTATRFPAYTFFHRRGRIPRRNRRPAGLSSHSCFGTRSERTSRDCPLAPSSGERPRTEIQMLYNDNGSSSVVPMLSASRLTSSQA